MKSITNSTIRFLVMILCLAGLSMTAIAQKKKPTTTKKPATTTTSTATNALELRAGADKVSVQIKNVSRFVYLLGGFAKAIEDLDAEARTRKISQTALEANNRNKQAVIKGIQNIRAGLIALETEFRSKNGLKLYAVRVEGVSNLAADAEVQATNGQFTESGKTLLLAIERLSDALAALP